MTETTSVWLILYGKDEKREHLCFYANREGVGCLLVESVSWPYSAGCSEASPKVIAKKNKNNSHQIIDTAFPAFPAPSLCSLWS